MKPAVFALAALVVAGPACAADRTIGITSFDRIIVEGPFAVTLVTGRPVSARASGELRALDTVSLTLDGRTLRVRSTGQGWGGYPGDVAGAVRIALATPELTTARVSGSGSLAITRMRGPRVSVGVEGTGRLSVDRIEADRADLVMAGSGLLTVAGTAKAATATFRGNGKVDAGALAANDIEINSQGGADVTVRASNSAKGNVSGTGDVTVLGNPACAITAQGSGNLVCGAKR
jgi:hypothetical protein